MNVLLSNFSKGTKQSKGTLAKGQNKNSHPTPATVTLNGQTIEGLFITKRPVFMMTYPVITCSKSHIN